MIIKTGDVQIVDVVTTDDFDQNDKKTRKILDKTLATKDEQLETPVTNNLEKN